MEFLISYIVKKEIIYKILKFKNLNKRISNLINIRLMKWIVVKRRNKNS